MDGTSIIQSDAMLDLISKLGVPAALVVTILIIVVKYIPKYLDMAMERMKQHQDYNNQRQKQCDEQISLFGKLVEQTNNTLANSTSVIERNNIIFEKSILSNERVANTLERLCVEFDDHDHRAENTNIDIVKIASSLGLSEIKNKQA